MESPVEAACSMLSNGDSRGQNGGSPSTKLDLSNSNNSPDLTSSNEPHTASDGPRDANGAKDVNGRDGSVDCNDDLNDCRTQLHSQPHSHESPRPKEAKDFQIHYSDTHLQNDANQQTAFARPVRSPSSQAPREDQPANRTESKRPGGQPNGKPEPKRPNECKLIDKSSSKLHTAQHTGQSAVHHRSSSNRPPHKSTHKSSADKSAEGSRSADQST